MRRYSFVFLSVLIGLFILSCGGSKGNKNNEEAANNIQNIKSELIVPLGATVNFKAMLEDGTDITESSEWDVSDDKIMQDNEDGSFTALNTGKTTITVKKGDKDISYSLSVQFPSIEDLSTKASYSQLVWGIENCVGHSGEKNKFHQYKIDNTEFVCKGDCDDAYFVITGDNLDLTLGVYKDKMYLISNKAQTVKFITIDKGSSWDSNSGKISKEDSRLNITIKNKYNETQKDKSESLYIAQKNPDYDGDEGADSVSIEVEAGDFIDINASFDGDWMTDGTTCKSNSTRFSGIRTESTKEDLDYTKGAYFLDKDKIKSKYQTQLKTTNEE